MSAPALAVHGLVKTFGGVRAVDDVSFHAAPGELLALIGPNGAGKSTCFACIGGQLKPNGGAVRLGERRIDGLPPRRVWRHGVSRTFQIPGLFDSMTAAECVQTALLSRARRLLDAWRRAPRFQTGRARDLLARVDAAHLAATPCGALAHGDAKRVELAVALANDPGVLLLDEPTAGMAAAERAALMDAAAAEARRHGRAVVFTEHDVDIVFTHADRVVVLDRGAVAADAAPDRVRRDPRVQRVYLGETEETAPC